MTVFFNLFLQRNLPQMFALLMEPYAMIQECHFATTTYSRTVVANFVSGKFEMFPQNPGQPLA